ncbi:MAG: VWA domain-containing protein [Candidatus Helarchaeota archaeon]
MISFDEIPEINYFIEFSHVLTKEQRKSFISYIAGRLSGTISSPPTNYSSEVSKKLYDQFELLISNSDLIQFCHQFPEIAIDVGVHFIKTISKTIKKCKYSHPFEKEEIMFTKYQQKNHISFLKYYARLGRYLSKIYTEDDINLSFYSHAAKELKNLYYKFYSPKKRVSKKKFSSENDKKLDKKTAPIFNNIKTKDDFELKSLSFKNELMNDWDGLLENKKLDYLLKEIDDARKEICEEIYSNIEKFKKLMKILEPFSNKLGRLWDLSKGNWANIGFDILSNYAKLLERQKDLQKLAEMLGRLHESETELEEDEIEVEKIYYSQKIDYAQKSEIISIHESDDIQYCIPQELVLLGSPESEFLFYLKFAEKKLLTYQLIDRLNIAKKRYEKQLDWVHVNKKGPIIICVDTSGSMHGTPETIAKTLCFAILRIALLENRRCFLISFSTSIKTIELTDFNRSYNSLIQFLSHSFHGGTDATPALKEALIQIKTKNYEKADVLMISDFIMGQIDEQTQLDISNAKEKKTKFHSLVISQSGNPSVIELFDNCWFYIPGKKGILKKIVNNFRKEI